MKRWAFVEGAQHVTAEDFRAVLSSFRVDREDREAQRQEYLRYAAKFTDDTAFLAEEEHDV